MKTNFIYASFAFLVRLTDSHSTDVISRSCSVPGPVFCTWETSGTGLLGEEADWAVSPGWAGSRGQQGLGLDAWGSVLGMHPALVT